MDQVWVLTVEADAEVVKAADALRIARERAAAGLAEIKNEETQE